MGRYELLRPLARGGMAEVFLARRRAAGVEKLLVVKRIRPERSGDTRFLDLFVREAKLSMSLAHQNIVPVFDFGRADDQVFLAMERVEGKDLGSSLARAKAAMPPLLAAFVAAECCQALDYAHQRKAPDGTALGIVHRDVTPRNVLLSWSGEVKLTDFGIAALAGDAASKLLGTPAFMAPEQARGEPTDARTDVYAIGLVLREAVTGQRARPGEDRDAILAAARAGELAPWTGDVPAELVAIVDRATACDPDARYPDARSLLEALDGFIVAERSARKGDAPARQLAAWLAAVWEGAREDRVGRTTSENPQLVSLFDGELEAVGTGTERSLLATVGDDEATPPAPPPPAPSTTTAAPRRSVLRIAIPLVAIAAAAIIAVVAWPRGESAAPVTLAPPAPSRIAERPPPAPPPTQEPVVEPPVAPATPPTQAKKDPPRPAHKPDKTAAVVAKPEPKQTIQSAPAAVGKRKVTINALPGWSHFTVDGDPSPHQTVETIELAPGPHRIHFKHPTLGVERDVTIDVPVDRDLKHVEDLRPAGAN